MYLRLTFPLNFIDKISPEISKAFIQLRTEFTSIDALISAIICYFQRFLGIMFTIDS
jgi:hypothetical protein